METVLSGSSRTRVPLGTTRSLTLRRKEAADKAHGESKEPFAPGFAAGLLRGAGIPAGRAWARGAPEFLFKPIGFKDGRQIIYCI